MRKLILIKHSSPAIDPAVVSHQWKLSDEGRRRCDALADAVKAHALAAILSSEEPKAAETAELLAARLQLPFSTAPDLHEHDRSNVPHMHGAEFQSAIAQFFQLPAELVLGRETADAALQRFQAAVEKVLLDHPEGNLAIVSHGTVITLLVARHNPVRPFPLWRQLALPSFVILSLPDFKLIETVARVGAPTAAASPPR